MRMDHDHGVAREAGALYSRVLMKEDGAAQLKKAWNSVLRAQQSGPS